MSQAGSEAGAQRAAAALLQAQGIGVFLRVPVPANGGDDGEQLGLAAPGFEDVELGRGVFRKANSTRVLLVTASAVEKTCSGGGTARAETMFARAAGVVVGDVLYGIEACEAMRAGDGVYAYALTLSAPVR